MATFLDVPHMIKKKDVPGLIKLLGSNAIADRNRAAEALGELGGAEATTALVKALAAERQPAPVSWMIYALKQIGLPAVKPLMVVMMDTPDYQSNNLYAALAAIGSRAVPTLEKILGAESGLRRKRAIIALSHVGGDAAAKILLEISKEDDDEQSQAAVDGLKRMGWHPEANAQGIETLISIKSWAPLADMGPEGISALCRELANRESHTDGEYLEIARLLGKTGGGEAVSALKSAFTRESGTLQVEIGRALAQGGGAEIVDFLLAELANHNSSAALILGESTDPRAFKPLLEAWVKNPKSMQIRHALEELSKCQDIDPGQLQEFKGLKSRFDQEEANLANPVWVLENMPISKPTPGKRQYAREEFLASYPTLESYSTGNYLADFCMVYHGLVEHCTVAHTGSASWEIIDQRHEDTDW